MTVNFTKWQPEKVIAEISNELMVNSEIAGKFVENEAKRRLIDIVEPEYGRPYRQKIVARLLMYVVERSKNTIVTQVGVAEGKHGRWHGFYIEMGSKTAPPHPFLRPSIFENGKKILALLAGK